MPHFIIECSKNAISQIPPESLMQHIHDVANSTELFNESDIKVRIKLYQEYLIGGRKEDFIHVFGNIMEGRSADQKNNLSKQIVSKLKSLFPKVNVISINIRDFLKDGYCNKGMV